MSNNVKKHFEARKKDERLLFLLDIVSSFSEGGRYAEGRYADLRPNSNVKLLIYRTKYLFRSAQMIQVRRLIQTSNLISRTQFIFMMYNGNLCIRFGT